MHPAPQFETDRGNWRGVAGVSVLSIELEYIHDTCRRRPYGSDGQKPIEAFFSKLFFEGGLHPLTQVVRIFVIWDLFIYLQL
jgi:hypothetical protein